MATTVYQREMSTGHLTDIWKDWGAYTGLVLLWARQFFHDLFKSSMTYGKLSLLKTVQKLSLLRHFWPNSGQQTQTLASTKIRAIRAVFAWKKQPTSSMISPRGNDKRNELRNSTMITSHYPDPSSASDWLKQISHAAWPIRSATQNWVYK